MSYTEWEQKHQKEIQRFVESFQTVKRPYNIEHKKRKIKKEDRFIMQYRKYVMQFEKRDVINRHHLCFKKRDEIDIVVIEHYF